MHIPIFFRFLMMFHTKSSGRVLIDVEIQENLVSYQLFLGFELAGNNCEYSFEVSASCCILFLSVIVFVFGTDLKS